MKNNPDWQILYKSSQIYNLFTFYQLCVHVPRLAFCWFYVNRSGGSQQCCGCLSDSPPPHRHEDLDRGSSASALDVEGTRRSVISMERRNGELRKQVIRRWRERVSDKKREHLSLLVFARSPRAWTHAVLHISLSDLLLAWLVLIKYSVWAWAAQTYLFLSLLLFAARFCT